MRFRQNDNGINYWGFNSVYNKKSNYKKTMLCNKQLSANPRTMN